jgi:predicted transcriptional regulator
MSIVAHHLAIAAVDGNFGPANSCAVDDRVVERKNLKNIAGFCVEEVDAVTERDFIKPLQIEQTTVICECPILPEASNFFDVIVRSIPLLFRKDEVGHYIATTIFTSPICSELKKIIDHLMRKFSFCDAVYYFWGLEVS